MLHRTIRARVHRGGNAVTGYQRGIPIFQAVAALLGADSFIGDEVDLSIELNTMIVDILTDRKAVPEDVSISFYSPLFDETSELIPHVVESM